MKDSGSDPHFRRPVRGRTAGTCSSAERDPSPPLSLGPNSNWLCTCGSTARPWRRWRRASGAPGGWRTCAETSSCRRCATCRSTPSCCARCTGSCTTSRSWSGCARTTRPTRPTSGTAEVSRAAPRGRPCRGRSSGPGSVAVSQVFRVPQGRHRSPVPGQGLPVISFHKVRIAKDSLFLPPWHVFPPLTVGGLVQRTLEALH